MTAGAFLLTALLACSLWLAMYMLAFVLVFPAAWGRMVDRMHEYFIDREVISSRVSNQMKVLEKGIVVRLGIAAVVLVIAMDLAICVMRYVLGLRI